MVYGIQFWIECKGGLKTANELSDVLDDLVYDGNLSLAYSNHSIMGAGLFMKNAVQNNFESIREILNEFADKIKYVSEWDYEDSSDMKWGVHTLGESKKSARKSLKEDSLDDIIPMGHSEYFDTLVEFFKDNDVPIRISHTVNGGKICYVENDMEFITVIFKSPKRGYELLKTIEMYSDGSTYLSRGKGGAWHSNHIPLEEVYVWDMDKDKFVNYKGKVLTNIDYNDIVESKKSARKSIKESYLDEVTNLYFFDLDVDEECEVQLENFVMPCRISQFYKNDRHMYLIVQSKTSDETYFVITYNYKKNKFVSSKVFSSYREAKNQLVDTIAMAF